MPYCDLPFDTKTVVASTSIAAWNALMRADPQFGRYALSTVGRSAFRIVFKTDILLRAKTAIARTSIDAWNALMRADPQFGRYALSKIGQSAFLSAFTVVENGIWRVGGRLHRVDGPAITYSNGTTEWYEQSRLHRIGGPARTWSDGREEWFEYGVPCPQKNGDRA